MQKLATTFVTLAITLSLLACNDRSVGVENNNNQNTNLNNNSNQNTNTNSYYLTRRTLFSSTATELANRPYTPGQYCEDSPYEDLRILNNDLLCWSVEVMNRLGVNTSSGMTNQFEPERRVVRHEMWRTVTEALGLLQYDAVCAHIIAEQPSRYYLGALCEKGLLAEYEPDELVSIVEWHSTMAPIEMYLELDTTRISFAETLVYYFHPHGSELMIEEWCQPLYPDVENNSIECSISRLAAEIEFVGYQDGTFNPHNSMNRAEIVKLVILASDIPADEETGCFEGVCETGEEWFCRYLDAACEHGILPDNFPHTVEEIASSPPLEESLHIIHEAYLLD